MCHTPEYQAWNGIRHRCRNPKRADYERYGGRGVTVCDRWYDSFEAFLSDMGKRPSSGHSIERKDNSKGYEPDNCQWATAKDQANNRRSSRMMTLGGITKTVAQWSDETGVPRNTLYHRLDRGWTPEQAIVV